MAREQLWINGVDLMAGVYGDVEDFTRSSPPPVGENPTVAGRSGAVWRPKRHGPGAFTITVWVGHPTEDRAAVQRRWDAVLRVCGAPMVPTEVEWVLSDGTTRSCLADVVGEISPTPIGQRGWRGQVEFTIPAAYWFGDNGSVSGSGGSLSLGWLAGSSAPLEHLTYTLVGATNPTVTSPSTGDTFTYAGSAGTLVVNSGMWTVTGGDARLLSYSGPRFLTVLPPPSGAPQVTWTGGGTLTVAGRAAFL